MTQQYPLMGTAVWIRKNGKILLARRSKGKRSGAGTWCPPGGHVEMRETIEECAIRETMEEAGVEIESMKLMRYVEKPNDPDDSHYVTFHFLADWKAGKPRAQAGETEEWHWFDWANLPTPLFKPAQDIVDLGINPLEFES